MNICFNSSNFKQRRARRQGFHSNSSEVKQRGAHSQRIHFNRKEENRVVSFVRDAILIAVNLKSILSVVRY